MEINIGLPSKLGRLTYTLCSKFWFFMVLKSTMSYYILLTDQLDQIICDDLKEKSFYFPRKIFTRELKLEVRLIISVFMLRWVKLLRHNLSFKSFIGTEMPRTEVFLKRKNLKGRYLIICHGF